MSGGLTKLKLGLGAFYIVGLLCSDTTLQQFYRCHDGPAIGVGEGKLYHTPLQECRQCNHLPGFGHEPVDGYITTSMTHGQCDAKPTVTFRAVERNHSLASTKLYSSATEAHRCQ